MRRLFSVMVAGGFLVGCDALFGPPPSDPTGETGEAALRPFTSEQELLDYFSGEITARHEDMGIGVMHMDFDVAVGMPVPGAAGFDGVTAEAPSAAGPGTAGGFSETTTQEIGVDESDVVKTDGTYLYILDGHTLRIVDAAPLDDLAEVGSVAVTGFGRDIYLREGRVIALTGTFGGDFHMLGSPGMVGEEVVDAETVEGVAAPPDGDAHGAIIVDGDVPVGIFPVVYTRPATIVTIIDVADPAAPRVVSETRFDGTLTSSRMIEGTLHVVIANYQRFFIDVMPMLGRPELDVRGMDVETLLPKFARTTPDGPAGAGHVMTWSSMYRPADPDGFGVVSIVSMDVAGDGAFQAIGIVAEPGLVYASTDALYLTDTDYNPFGGLRETTDIYKFTYTDGGVVPVAAGSVPGRILNQYAMGEHDHRLRVATSLGARFARGGFTEPASGVYVLAETDAGLGITGRIENIAPGETIQSARFTGDRGYLVTFEQIDPLFTLDLSDPTNPRLVGELKVPGFSTHIIPIDDDHLLTVGRYIPEDGFFFGGGVQLSIFDVSDFADPVLTHLAVIGAQGADSEALWNPKALTYFAEQGLVALPVSMFGTPMFVEPIEVDPPPSDAVDEDAVQDPDASATVDGDMNDADDAAPPADPTAPPDDVPNDAADDAPPDDAVIDAPVFDPDSFQGVVVFSVSTDAGFEELGRIDTRFADALYYYPMFTRGVFIDDAVYAITESSIHAAPLDGLGGAAPPATLIFGAASPDDADADRPPPPPMPDDGGTVSMP
ncbi:MAG: beta-propeller domain-containing protein [Phycisphaerae bacterium]